MVSRLTVARVDMHWAHSAKNTINTDKYDFRVDQNFGEKTRLFGRFSQQEDVRYVPGPLPLPIGGGRSTTEEERAELADIEAAKRRIGPGSAPKDSSSNTTAS